MLFVSEVYLEHFLFLTQNANLVEVSKLTGHYRENICLKSALWLIACGYSHPGWNTAASVRFPSL